jgi:nitrite reductase (NADH) small subunit
MLCWSVVSGAFRNNTGGSIGVGRGSRRGRADGNRPLDRRRCNTRHIPRFTDIACRVVTTVVQPAPSKRMPPWIQVCDVTDCPPGQGREFVVGERIVAVFQVDGQFFALDGICPHQGGPLGKGTLRGCIVTCPWHGWQFDVTTGQHQTSRSLVHGRFTVKVEGQAILIELDP